MAQPGGTSESLGFGRRIVRLFAAALAGLALAACDGQASNTSAPHANSAASPLAMASVRYAGDAGQLPPDAMVYVFAREAGQRMPLAVEKLTVDQLPMQVGFANPRAGIGPVEIVARLSLTGAVNRHPGDPEVVSSPIDPAGKAQVVNLTLPAAGDAGAVAGGGTRLRLELELAAGIEYSPRSKVYLIARGVGDARPMPLAVKTLNPSQLPLVTELTDRNSLVALNKLGNHEEVVVLARLSLSGEPTRQAGDLESDTIRMSTASAAVARLVIGSPQ